MDPAASLANLSRGHVDEEDFDEFMGKVNEAEKLIKGLVSGDVDPSALEQKERDFKRREEEAQQKKVLEEQRRQLARKKKQEDEERKKWGFVGKWCPQCQAEKPVESETCEKCKTVLLSSEERKQQLLEKVEQLRERRRLNDLAKDRWTRWKSAKQYKGLSANYDDYFKWDSFIDSDDEEELPPPPPPDTAEFRAMEKDMDDRAKVRAQKRKEADKKKEEGNAAFKAGDLKKAVRIYSDGIDLCKDHKVLRNNRALLNVKLKRFDRAVEDCTRVLDIIELFDKYEGPGVRDAHIKALVRRSAGFAGLQKCEDALKDAQEAAKLDPSSKEIQSVLHQRQVEFDEGQRAQNIRSQLKLDGKKTQKGEAQEEEEREEQEEQDVAESDSSSKEVASEVNSQPSVAPKEADEERKPEPVSAKTKADKENHEANHEVADSASAVLIEAGSIVEETRKALIPLTVRPKDGEKAAEASILDKLKRNLNRLVELGDDGDVLVLLRDRRVFHQLMASIVVRGWDVGFALEAVKVLVLCMNSERNAMDAVNYKDRRFLSSVVNAFPMHSSSAASQPGAPSPSESNKSSAAAPSGAVNDEQLLTQLAYMVELMSQYECARSALIDIGCMKGLFDNILTRNPKMVSSILSVVGNVAFEAKGKEELRAITPPPVALLAPLLVVTEAGVRTRAARAIMNISTDPVLQQPLLEEAALKFFTGVINAELKAGTAADASLLQSITSACANLALNEGFAAAAHAADTTKSMQSLLLKFSSEEVVRTTLLGLSRVCKTATIAKDLATEEFVHKVIDLCGDQQSSGENAVRLMAVFCSVVDGAPQLVFSHKKGVSNIVKSLASSNEQVAGNAALCVLKLSTIDSKLEEMGKAGAIGPLIDTIRKRRGPAQKNAAVALAKLSRNGSNMQVIQALHGLEVLQSYFKG